MKLALATLGTALALGAPALAQTVVPVPPPIVLPAPPPGGGSANALLFDALLSIARAQAANPPAAQTAAFAYMKAIQQARVGDLNGARASARDAIVQSSPLAPVAIPTIAPYSAPIIAQRPLFGGSAAAIDAAAFLALTRGQLAACRERVAPAARLRYARAQADFAAQKYEATRVDARAAIDLCAQAR